MRMTRAHGDAGRMARSARGGMARETAMVRGAREAARARRRCCARACADGVRHSLTLFDDSTGRFGVV